MAWRAITEADLLQKMSSDELEALRAAGLSSGQADPIAGHISSLTNYVRGYIEANRNNTMGEVGTLPERIILPAVDYLIGEVGSRVAGLFIDLNGIRKTAYDNALALFKSVAAGTFIPDVPSIVSTEATSSLSPSMYHKHHRFSRHDQEGT